MATNLLEAIANLVDVSFAALGSSSSLNKMNRQGEPLEQFVRDAFCPVEESLDVLKAQKLRSNCFSYLGNQNNPPDFMIRGGDAVEVKKIEGKVGRIALNSSYPKQKLKSSSKMITEACRKAEVWKEKDNLYVVGELLRDKSIQHLWFVYGDCYSAQEETYESIRAIIRKGVRDLELDLAETRELGRVNGVDPLGITNLRIRGMWDIAGPREVFQGLYKPIDAKPSIFAVMRLEKYEAFPESSRLRLESLAPRGVERKMAQVRSPDNPAQLLDAVIINWTGR